VVWPGEGEGHIVYGLVVEKNDKGNKELFISFLIVCENSFKPPFKNTGLVLKLECG